MSSHIFIGLWSDYDLSPAFRKVWTVPSRTGTVIITLLAILVTFTANRSWKIWRFLLHGLLEATSRRFPKQTQLFIRQQQAILRNSETAGGALLSMLDFVTKKQFPARERALAIIMAVFMLLHWGLFLTLGIFTTRVNLGNTVRSLATNDSGIWFPTPGMDQRAMFDPSVSTSSELNINKTIAAENYMRNCYTSTSTTISDCNLFAQKLLSHTTRLIPCPLRSTGLCIGPDSGALVVESSNISWSDLGINWLHSNDVYFRRRSTFTPIDASSFLYDKEASSDLVDRYILSDPPLESPEQIQAFSFTVDEAGLNVTQTYRRDDSGGEYHILTVPARNGSFVVEALRPQDLVPEITIIAICGRGITFPNPSDDPIFYAHRDHTMELSTGSQNFTLTLYKMDRPLNVLFVQDQIEICSKLTSYCSGWIAPNDFAQSFAKTYTPRLMGPDFVKDYNTTLDALSIVALPLMQATTYFALLNRGASGLQATRQVQPGIQYMISAEQWKLEAEHWFRITLASLQMAPYRMVFTPELDRNRVVDGFGSTWAFSSVKSHSSKHMTLSFSGILIIVIVSIFLTLLSYLDDIVGFLAKRRSASILQPWTRDGYLQLLEQSNASTVSEAALGAELLRIPGTKSKKLVLTVSDRRDGEENQTTNE